MNPPIEHSDLQHVLQHTRQLWKEFRGSRIFVTGGTGFFGSWLVETFCFANEELGLGAQLHCLTRDPVTFERRAPHLARRGDVRLIQGDVRHFAFPQGVFSHVIHAGATSGRPVAPLEEFDTIVAGTRRVLDFCVAASTQRLLFVNSGAVYGKQPSELEYIPETYIGAPDLGNPRAVYGEAKRAAELLCAIYQRELGLQSTIARCFAFVGPHLPLDAHFAIGNFIRDGIDGKAIVVHGDGTPYRSYLYAADLMIWLWTILVCGRPSRPYNVGSEDAVRIDQLAGVVAQCFVPNSSVTFGARPISGESVDRYVPSTDRARTELGLTQRIDLRMAIKRTIDWNLGRSDFQTARSAT